MSIKQRSPKKQLWVILATVFFGFLGISMPYLIFPSIFMNPSYTILPPETTQSMRGMLLGITLAAYPLGQFLGSPLLGTLSDDYGRKKILSLSLFIAALCNLLTVFSLKGELLWVLILSRFLGGLMEGNLSIARAMAADLKQLRKHDSFGKINAATSIAYVLGPLIGGLLSDQSIYQDLSLSTPFFIVAIIFFILSIASYFSMSETYNPLNSPSIGFWQKINVLRRLPPLFKNRQLKHLLLIATLYTLAVDMFYEFGPVYLTTKWLFGPAKLAIYNGSLSLALSIGSGWIAGKLALRFPDRKILVWAMSALSVGLIGIVLPIGPMITLAIFALIGFPIAISTTNLTVQVSDASPDTIQGEVMGIQTSLRVLGNGMICLIGGSLISLSSAIVLILAAGIALISLVCYLRNFSRELPLNKM